MILITIIIKRSNLCPIHSRVPDRVFRPLLGLTCEPLFFLFFFECTVSLSYLLSYLLYFALINFARFSPLSPPPKETIRDFPTSPASFPHFPPPRASIRAFQTLPSSFPHFPPLFFFFKGLKAVSFRSCSNRRLFFFFFSNFFWFFWTFFFLIAIDDDSNVFCIYYNCPITYPKVLIPKLANQKLANPYLPSKRQPRTLKSAGNPDAGHIPPS